MVSGKPCPPLRYSSIALDLEREFPDLEPLEIHLRAGKRLAEMMEARKALENGKGVQALVNTGTASAALTSVNSVSNRVPQTGRRGKKRKIEAK